MSKFSAEELLAGLKSGDTMVVRSIYDDVFPKVKYVLQKKGADLNDIHDVFQETLEILLLKIDHIHSSFEGLVLQLAKRRWIDVMRRRKREQVRNDQVLRHIDRAVQVEDQIIQAEDEYLRYQVMENTFLKLSQRCQELLSAVRQGKSVKEMVTTMDFSSANTLYRRKSACIERWSRLIQDSQGKYIDK